MRIVFLLLVLANVGFFAITHYWRPSATADAGAPPGQSDAGALKIVPPPGASTKPQARAQTSMACLEWGGFTAADYPRAEKALEPLALAGRVTLRRSEEKAAWWVYIPSPGNRQAALNMAAELNALGVDDYFVVPDDGESRWAISLGVFKTEEPAYARLRSLRAQGLRSATVGTRETGASKIWLQVKNVDEALQVRLREIARELAGSELRACR